MTIPPHCICPECQFMHDPPAPVPEHRFKIVGDYVLFHGQSVATLDPLMNASLRDEIVDVLTHRIAKL